MAYIRVVGADEAEGKLFEIYDKVQRSRGRLSNILSVESLNPEGMRAHLDLYTTLMFGKAPLSRRERELIALVVSSTNHCTYCMVHHSEALEAQVRDQDWVKGLANDPRGFELDKRERALADFAIGLTKSPSEGRKEGFQALRKAGFTDEEVLHATECVAYFNFVNRLASGLGVELEDPEQRDYNY